jgi:predicted dinucleotide-binding enzyme
MKIATIGAGNVGGGLANLWERAGHDVTSIAREGGDVSDAEVVLLAVPSDAIADALGKVDGLSGKVVVDATNLVRGDRPQGFNSLAEYVKSLTNGPVAKAFNTVFAALYERLGETRSKPSCLFCGDDEAKEKAAALIEAAGYEPVDAGGLDSARALEDMLRVNFAVSQAGMGQFVYRMAPPERL